MDAAELRRQIDHHLAEVRRLKKLLREAGESANLAQRIVDEAPWATSLEIASIVGCQRRYVDRTLRAKGWSSTRQLMMHPATKRRRWMLVWVPPKEKTPGHR